MVEEEYNTIVKTLPEILKSPHDVKGAQYYIWYQGKWVVKQPQPEPPFSNGRI